MSLQGPARGGVLRENTPSEKAATRSPERPCEVRGAVGPTTSTSSPPAPHFVSLTPELSLLSPSRDSDSGFRAHTSKGHEHTLPGRRRGAEGSPADGPPSAELWGAGRSAVAPPCYAATAEVARQAPTHQPPRPGPSVAAAGPWRSRALRGKGGRLGSLSPVFRGRNGFV